MKLAKTTKSIDARELTSEEVTRNEQRANEIARGWGFTAEEAVFVREEPSLYS